MESTPAAYADAFRRAYDEAAALAGGLTAEQFNWKPAPDVWSVAECLVHLNRANAPYPEAMERALEGAPKGTPPFRYGPVARWFIASVGPRPKRKVKTIPKMAPAPATDYAADRVLADFRALTDDFLRIIARAEREGLDLARVRIGSPFVPLLRLPVGAFLEALAGHEQRHLDQARRVTERPEFPRQSGPGSASPTTSNR
ncbi:MAG TPA: DinB family protein [Rubricoccaceae bacterium]|nr:DinB family protein [Rubricoccaceae bacterium]